MTIRSCNNMRVAVLFERLGPYHDVRLSAARRQGDIVAVERSSVDDVYSWNEIHTSGNYQKINVFGHSASSPNRTRELQKRLEDCLQRIKPDVVAIPGWSTSGALAALRWSIAAAVPAIVMSDSWNDGERRGRWKEAVKRQIIPLFASGLVAGSPHVDYLEALGMPRENIFQGYDVVDNEHFNRGAAAARRNLAETKRELNVPEKFFLAVCRFVTEKNLVTLIEAFAKYQAHAPGEPWHLVIVGDGPLRHGLEARCRQLRIDEYVHFPGFKQYHDLPLYYGTAQALILASMSETWGLVVNEAMSAGLPVLVSNRCGCCRDLVDDGRNGLCFDPLDVDAIRAAMTRIASPDSDRRSMGQVGRQLISRWSPELFAEALWQAARCAAKAPRIHAGVVGKVVLAATSRRRIYS
jgi:glycosyltransferase involved in cell wall biosynthesis